MDAIWVVDPAGNTHELELTPTSAYGFVRDSAYDKFVYRGAGRDGVLTALAEVLAANHRDGFYNVYQEQLVDARSRRTYALQCERRAIATMRRLEEEFDAKVRHGMDLESDAGRSELFLLDAARQEVVRYGCEMDDVDTFFMFSELIPKVVDMVNSKTFDPHTLIPASHVRAARLTFPHLTEPTYGDFVAGTIHRDGLGSYAFSKLNIIRTKRRTSGSTP